MYDVEFTTSGTANYHREIVSCRQFIGLLLSVQFLKEYSLFHTFSSLLIPNRCGHELISIFIYQLSKNYDSFATLFSVVRSVLNIGKIVWSWAYPSIVVSLKKLLNQQQQLFGGGDSKLLRNQFIHHIHYFIFVRFDTVIKASENSSHFPRYSESNHLSRCNSKNWCKLLFWKQNSAALVVFPWSKLKIQVHNPISITVPIHFHASLAVRSGWLCRRSEWK